MNSEICTGSAGTGSAARPQKPANKTSRNNTRREFRRQNITLANNSLLKDLGLISLPDRHPTVTCELAWSGFFQRPEGRGHDAKLPGATGQTTEHGRPCVHSDSPGER